MTDRLGLWWSGYETEGNGHNLFGLQVRYRNYDVGVGTWTRVEALNFRTVGKGRILSYTLDVRADGVATMQRLVIPVAGAFYNITPTVRCWGFRNEGLGFALVTLTTEHGSCTKGFPIGRP